MSDLTKKALRDSLIRLLMKKPFDKITVRDITDECEVSRMTFYYHFKDIYDLLEWTAKAEQEKLLSYLQDGHAWEETFVEMLSKLEESIWIDNILESKAAVSFQNNLYEMIYAILDKEIENRVVGNDSVNVQNQKFIADFYKYAIGGILVEWIRGGMEISSGDLIAGFSYLMEDIFQKISIAE